LAEGKLRVVIATPEKKIWEETVASEATLPSVFGELTVLPGHEPLLFLLETGDMRIKADGREEWFFVDRGFAEILENDVMVCPEVGENAKDIDVERAKRAKERAEKRLVLVGDPNIDIARAEYALKRALYRLNVAEYRSVKPKF